MEAFKTSSVKMHGGPGRNHRPDNEHCYVYIIFRFSFAPFKFVTEIHVFIYENIFSGRVGEEARRSVGRSSNEQVAETRELKLLTD